MKLIKEILSTRAKGFIDKVADDNLFLLSSSISYYSALALAPFMLILLWVASLLGQDIQQQIIHHVTYNFSSQIGEMIEMVFKNVNQGVNIGSVSGLVGFAVLIWTCSVVFLQFRYSFDVIYGYYNRENVKTWTEFFLEKLFAMFLVLMAALILIATFVGAAIVEYLIGPETQIEFLYRILLFLSNYLIYLGLFSLIHYFTPSKRQDLRQVVRIAGLTSIFFLIGNILLASYLKRFAGSSVYGAAGTLLIFLIWAYYSSFTIFLSVEVFEYLKKIRKRQRLEVKTIDEE